MVTLRGINSCSEIISADLVLLNRNGAKSVLVMAKKCLERAEDIFVDMIENKSTMAVDDDHAPPLPTRCKNSEEQFNGTESTVRLVVMLSRKLLSGDIAVNCITCLQWKKQGLKTKN